MIDELHEIREAITSVVGAENADLTLMQLAEAISEASPEEQAFIVDTLLEDPHQVVAALNPPSDDEYADIRQQYGHEMAELVEQQALADEVEQFNAAIDQTERNFQEAGIPFDRSAYYGLLDANDVDFDAANEAYAEMVEQARENDITDREIAAVHLQLDREEAIANRADKIADKSPARDALDRAVQEYQAEAQLRAEANSTPTKPNDPVSGGDLGTALDDFLQAEPIVKEATTKTLAVVDPHGALSAAERQRLLDDGMAKVSTVDTPESIYEDTVTGKSATNSIGDGKSDLQRIAEHRARSAQTSKA